MNFNMMQESSRVAKPYTLEMQLKKNVKSKRAAKEEKEYLKCLLLEQGYEKSDFVIGIKPTE